MEEQVRKNKKQEISMKNFNFDISKLALVELDESEIRITSGGDKFSEDVFYFIGKSFEYLNRFSQNGAPRGGTYKHSG